MASPSTKGGLGWAILAVALAIPGFLFYNWWSHLKAERQKAISQKARGRVPEGGVFATPAPGGEKLVNPISASTAAPVADAVAAGAAAPTLAPAGAAFAAAAAVAAPDASAGASAPEAAAPASADPAPAPLDAAPASAVAPLPRDPTLSPMDIVRIQQEDMEKRLAEERMRDELSRRRTPPKRVEPPIERFVELQGIVANANGENKAIVNDAVVAAGETFDARGRTVRVLKITAAGVTFQYKTKRFVKNVSRDE